LYVDFFVDRVTALFQDGRQCVDAPATATQMVLGPWFIETGGFTGAFQPAPLASTHPVEQRQLMALVFAAGHVTAALPHTKAARARHSRSSWRAMAAATISEMATLATDWQLHSTRRLCTHGA
jgi:hypothetical protein